jgi:hypothetical protein
LGLAKGSAVKSTFNKSRRYVSKEAMRFIILIMLLSSMSCFAQEKCGDSLKPVKFIPPKYPIVEIHPKHTGSVVVEFVLQENGSVINAIAFKSTSEPTQRYAKHFAKSAVVAVSQSTFSARHYPCRGQYKLTFELSNE